MSPRLSATAMASLSPEKLRKIQYVRKHMLIKKVTDSVRQSSLAAVCHVGNLDVHQTRLVNRKLEGVGAQMLGTKNTLTRLGLERAGVEGLAPLLRGTTALATGPAEVPLAKALLELGKELPNFFVMGALVNGKRVLQVNDDAIGMDERARATPSPAPCPLSSSSSPPMCPVS